MKSEVYHIPALLKETITGLDIKPDGIYLDLTFGGGGHSRAILGQLGKNGKLFSFDQDIEAFYNLQFNDTCSDTLLKETITGLDIKPDGIYLDLTFGGGGHSRAILGQLGKNGKLFSFDQDIEAFYNLQFNDTCSDTLLKDKRWQFVHSNFRYISQWMDFYDIPAVDGILADLGVSFHHFDTASRGFSFRFEGDLDMRMNQKGGKTAADILNIYAEEDIANLLYTYGEIKTSRHIAGKIVKVRTEHPLKRIEQLTDIIGEDKKLLTLVFQAIRIEVNDELGALRQMLLSSTRLLKQGGRIAILTYHSLEDRLVKNFFRSGNMEGKIEKDFYGNPLTPFNIIEKGLIASTQEVEQNPRSRSAKLRVAEKK